MSTTTPTNNPIPSESPRDFRFNIGNFDRVMNSDDEAYQDKFGKARLTMAGFEAEANRLFQTIGWMELGDWAVGLTVTTRNQIVYYNGSWYRYMGTQLPYTITASSPDSNWVNIGDASLRQELHAPSGSSLVSYQYPATGSVNRSVQDKLGDFVSVRDFGAKGDGSSNDTAAIQLAINTGKNIHIPAGIYKVDSLEITKSQRIVGENRKTTELQPIGTGACIYINGVSREYGQRVSDVYLENITFSNIGSGTPFLIVAKYTNNLKIENCTIYHGVVQLHCYYYPTFKEVNLFDGIIYCEPELLDGEVSFDYGNGAQFDRIWSSNGKIEVRNGTDTRVINSYFYNSQAGLVIELDDWFVGRAPRFLGGVVFIDNLVCECITSIKYIALSRISNSSFGAFNGTGLLIDGARELVVTNSICHYSSGDGMRLRNAKNCTFSSCSFSNTENSGVDIDSSEQITFAGCSSGTIEIYE